RAGELRERQHWHVQLARQPLQPPADLRDLLHAVLVSLAAATTLRQLQVVHDEEIEPPLQHQPARFAAYLDQWDARRVVDVDVGLREPPHRLTDAPPLVVIYPARAQPLLVYPRVHREQARDQLLLAHLQAEDPHAVSVPEGCIVRQRQSKRGVVDD